MGICIGTSKLVKHVSNLRVPDVGSQVPDGLRDVRGDRFVPSEPVAEETELQFQFQPVFEYQFGFQFPSICNTSSSLSAFT